MHWIYQEQPELPEKTDWFSKIFQLFKAQWWWGGYRWEAEVPVRACDLWWCWGPKQGDMSLGVSKTFLSFSETSVSASLGTPKPPHRTPLRASCQNDAAPWGRPPVTSHSLLRISPHYLTGTLNWGPCSKPAHLQSPLWKAAKAVLKRGWGHVISP